MFHREGVKRGFGGASLDLAHLWENLTVL
jgi:hypothetical protein